MSVHKPNILFITTDTQRTDTLHCMGSSFALSPNLDRLASEGVLFTRAYTASPACMPARCSFMSGLHTPLHGCIENGIDRYEDMPFFTNTLKELGYQTIMIGKTHFGPLPASFDVHEIVKGEKNHIRNDDFTKFFQDSGWPENSGWPNSVPEECCLDSLIIDRTLYHMEQALEKDQPFFTFCSLLSPHSPLDPPGRWTDFYSPDQIPAPHFKPDEWKSLPTQLRQLCGLSAKNSDIVLSSDDWISRVTEALGNTADNCDMEEIKKYKALYYSSAAWCDFLVGRLIQFLDQKKLRENTLIIFTSDHGQQYFDHGFNDKHNYYEETWHVPLIFSLPGTLPQGHREEFASGTDLAPTIIGAAGGTYDIANGYDLFTPMARGETLPRHCAAASLQLSMAIVTRRWKLEYYIDHQEIRLYDLHNDPHEDQDLSQSSEYQEIKEQMLNSLLIWRSSMINPADFSKRTGKGGPVAARAATMLRSIKGNTCEMFLEKFLYNL